MKKYTVHVMGSAFKDIKTKDFRTLLFAYLYADWNADQMALNIYIENNRSKKLYNHSIYDLDNFKNTIKS
jgi:hypothetical protein